MADWDWYCGTETGTWIMTGTGTHKSKTGGIGTGTWFGIRTGTGTWFRNRTGGLELKLEDWVVPRVVT